MGACRPRNTCITRLLREKEMRVVEHGTHPGVYLVKGRLATVNAVPGVRVHGEQLFKHKGREYREWNPRQSKLAAAIAKGMKSAAIQPDSVVLYLGAANGATPSHVSDMVTEGGVYCVEFSARAARDLLKVCGLRENTVPIVADARKPEEYADIGRVDAIFEDVADPEQARILKENARFLGKGGWALLAVKSACIDSSKRPAEVFAQVKKDLRDCFELVEEIDLEPFEAGHEMLVLKKK